MLKFLQIAFIVQMPHLKLLEEAEKVKGEALNEQEKNELNRRAEYAFRWLRNIADEKFQYSLRKCGLSCFQSFSPTTQTFLQTLAQKLESSQSWSPEDIQKIVFEQIKQFNFEPKEGFAYIYQLFLSKSSGPQLGWFLHSLERKFALERLKGLI